MVWFNKNHLEDAAEYGKLPGSNPVSRYFWHFKLAIVEAIKLFGLFLGSVIHAIFPWIFNFKLLEWRISMLRDLKRKLPNDPNLKKVNFLD
jgi:hypothetical protein